MVVEIHGTGTHNRGAELMALAIAEHLRARSCTVTIAVPRSFGVRRTRSRYGFLSTRDGYLGRRGRWLARWVPAAAWRSAGIIEPRDVDVVLDASGFAFSDSWGAMPARQLLAKMNEPQRRHQKLVLLPQALGPFNHPDVADACRALLDRAELVLARDEESFAATRALGTASDLRLCPDFTQPVPGERPADLPVRPPFVAIVPNVRMVDKTTDGTGTAYVQFLAHAAHSCSREGLTPLVLLHDAVEDRGLLPSLHAAAGPLPVYTSANPLVLKGVLGMADIVIGSRYHALVGALSQGVPCIGAGWSHKYRWLFEDFGCPAHLVGDVTNLRRIDELVAEARVAEKYSALKTRIQERASAQRDQVDSMGREVDQRIGLT